jgi:repressor LexA
MVAEHRDVFAWRMPDQSMHDRGIHEGDYVLANRTTRVHDGDLVIALIGDEAFCRLFYQNGRQIQLKPANDQFDVLCIPKAPFMESTIMGQVIGLYRTL